MVSQQQHAARVSSGVEALIERLREEGVIAGREEAAKIVTEAETRADWMLRQAREEAERIRSEAQKEAEQLQNSGREALRAAARDVMLDLKASLTGRFTGDVHRLVREELDKQELLQQLILTLVGRMRSEVEAANEVEVLLPRDAVALDELMRTPDELQQGTLTHFVRVLAADMLREGVTLLPAEDDHGGLRLRLRDQAIGIDLSDKAVAALLLQHLQPRFRALLEGIVR